MDVPGDPAPLPTSLPRSVAVYGPTGTGGVVLPGVSQAQELPRGRWLGVVHARLRVGQNHDPYVPGQVLIVIDVRAAGSGSRTIEGGGDTVVGRYAVRGYLSVGRGLVCYPNVWVGDDKVALEATIWSLDNLPAQPIADVTYTMTDGPIPGTDSVDTCDNPDSWAPITLQSTDPAVNVEASLTIGAGMQVRPDDVWATLVTDGTAASRECYLSITRSAVIIAYHTPVTTQPASTTRTHVWRRGGSTGNTSIGGAHHNGLSDLVLRDEDVVATSTGARQVTDNWGVLTLAGRYRVVPEVLDPA